MDALRSSLRGLAPKPTNVRLLQGPLLAAVEEGVRARKAGEITAPLVSFWEFLTKTGIEIEGSDERLRLRISCSTLRTYIIEVLGYRWPRSTGATGIQIVPRSR